MEASRRRACSSSSRTIMPAPSPMTKPSRSLSHGRLARAGSSLRVESARMAANPPTPMGVMAASEPPAIITSASPCWMMRMESPVEGALVGQAVAGGQVNDGGGNEERRDLARAALDERGVFALDHIESADARADVNAYVFG